MTEDTLQLVVENPGAERLDFYLLEKIESLTRSAAQKLISKGYVEVTRGTENVPATPKLKLMTDDRISITKPVVKKLDIDIEIIYEDRDTLVVNKPYGVLSQDKPTSIKTESSLTDVVTDKIAEDTPRNGLVHRLDRTTSGVMILAKNKSAYGFYSEEFEQRRVEKTYVALVEGVYDKEVPLLIDAPITRSVNKRTKYEVGRGKESQTKIIASLTDESSKFTILALSPITGRTHQLRAHLDYIGYKIAGDSLYGAQKSIKRVMLHAYKLKINCFDGENREFTSSPDKEFISAINNVADFGVNLEQWLQDL